MPILGSQAPHFALPNTNPNIGNSPVSLEDYRDTKALLIAFWCNHCPYVIHIRDKFVDFADRYQDKGLAIVAICANDSVGYPEDSPEKMTQEARQHRFPFPYLHDDSQTVARTYQAVCTPDFFLYDGNLSLHYRGRFDSSPPGNGHPITGDDLAAAADSALNGTPPPARQEPSMGCSIKWK